MLEKMYHKRLNGYASIGYKVKGESLAEESMNIIFDNRSFLPVYTNDILNSAREVLIVSPFVTQKRTLQMLKDIEKVIKNKVQITVVTKPIEDFKNNKTTSLERALDLLYNAGIHVIYKSNIHQKFAVIDQKIVWYGSINFLSFGSSEESIMRLNSPNIANELIKSLGVY